MAISQFARPFGRNTGTAPGLMGLAPIRIPKTAEIVADAIRRRITSGELREGDTLQPEARIIQNFAVSRPTVREAFRILESENLISVSRGPRGGAHVHPPKAERVARYAGFVLQAKKATYTDVYQARSLIEPPAARHVAETRSHDAPTILRAVMAEEHAAHRSERIGGAVARFHTRLIELTGNETLMLVCGMFDGIVARFQSEVVAARRESLGDNRQNFDAGMKSQEKLVEFIAAGDGSAAEAHWRSHMRNAAKVWLRDDGAAIVNWTD